MNDAIANMIDLLRRDGQVVDPQARLVPLSGGVSSEIYLVEDGSDKFVVKRALPKLKVKDSWFADVNRNRNEAAYLSYVASFRPQNVPRLRYVNEDHGYFCMEYLGEDCRNWKQLMLDGQCDLDVAAAAGDFLGTVHAHSSQDPVAAETFSNLHNFEQLRIEPYLLATARHHPALKNVIEAEAERLRSQREVLTHGDFSPKNILVGENGIYVTDCEVAWYGDAAFDVAFLLNHLFLKSLVRPSQGDQLRIMVDQAWDSYVSARFAERKSAEKAGIEKIIPRLLVLLLLARVDGKSPVEYLTAEQRGYVRAFVTSRLSSKQMTMSSLRAEWFGALQKVHGIPERKQAL
jgi:5-methylthioribose kinase